MQDKNLTDYLDCLASRSPAPGGGAVAAITAAQSAALISMVCNLTIGKAKYKHNDAQLIYILHEADEIRTKCLAAGADDESAFNHVMTCYKGNGDLQGALKGATAPPSMLLGLCSEIERLSVKLRPIANINLLSDIDISEIMTAASKKSCVVNIEVNLKDIVDESFNEIKRREYEKK